VFGLHDDWANHLIGWEFGVDRSDAGQNGNARSNAERRQQAEIEQLTLRIRRKEDRCRA
jgi:hypothetical protein